jgi:hypothetical protein
VLRTALGRAAPVMAAAALLAACGGGPDPATTAPETAGAAAPSAVDEDAATAAPPSAPGALDLSAEVLADGTILVDGDQASFLMPSTNLVCVLRPDGVVCQIHEKQFTPKAADLAPDRAEECTAEVADGLSVSGGEPARWTCLPEDLRGWSSVETGGGWVGAGHGSTREVDGVEHAVLPYGSTLRLGDVACESRREGVECADLSTGRSLFLARERYGTG